MPDETTISSFQNYSHEGSGDGEESICWNKMLPINEITNSIFFYQVIGFKEKIQLDQFIDENIPPEDIKNITRSDPLNSIVQPTLALSLGLINPEYSMPTNIRQINVQPGKPMLVGMDRTLFPGKRVKPYSGEKKDSIVVDDPSKLDIGINSYNKQKFIVTQKTKEILMEYGEAYAKDPDSGNKVLIKLDSKKVHVDSFGQITQKNTLLVGEQELDLKISQNNLVKLRKAGRAFGFVDGKPAHILLTPKPKFSNVQYLSSRAPSATDLRGLESPEWEMDFKPPEKVSLSYYCSTLNSFMTDLYFSKLYDIFFEGKELKCNINEVQPENFERQYVRLMESYFKDARYDWCMAQSVDELANAPDLPKFEIGILSKYKQDWKMLGYSRGALLSSITLAPQEKVTIEVFTWDRLKIQEEQTFGTEFEKNREINTLSRGSTIIANDLRDMIGTNAGGNLGIGVPIEYVNLDLGVDGSVNTSVENNLNTTLDFLDESTITSSERYKSTHQVKITQVRETGALPLLL